MIGPWAWWLLAEVIGGVTAISFIFGGFAGYRFGRRDGLEENSWIRDEPPVLLGEELPPPLAPLDPSDPVDAMILEARMREP